MDDYRLAKLAANWWIDEMKKRCYDLYPQKVINDKSCFVVVDECFARELSRFEAILLDEILMCIQMRGYLSLTCCFFPCKELSNLTKKAQLSTEYLPIRASMQICGTSVKVSLNGDDLRKLPTPAK